MNNRSTPETTSRFAAVWFTLRMIEVRLRFVAVLVAMGLIIGYWETLNNYWDHWTRPAIATASQVDNGTEFYCPMDPSVVRDGLEPNGAIPKCPICGMPLSLRKKGAPMQLPPGVVGRVSLSPNRVRMAGIRTSAIEVRPMVSTIRTVGNVMYDESRQSQIVSRIDGYIEKLFVDTTFAEVKQGDPLAAIYSPELYAAVQELKITNDLPGSRLGEMARQKIRLLGIEDREIDSMLRDDASQTQVIVRSPASGQVIQKMVQQGATVSAGQILFEIADLSRVWIEADIYERDLGLLQVGQAIEATVEAYPATVFKGQVSLIYPQVNRATRTNRVRFELDNSDRRLRAGMYATVTLTTPIQDTEPFHSTLVASHTAAADPAAAIAMQAVCPVTGAKLGSMGEPIAVQAGMQTVYLCCAACQKAIDREPEKYVSRLRIVSDLGVLSVPESAVIDTGEQQIVYVEREAGVYEGVVVELGPKSEGYYAVISGLLPGDRVAAAGAFLIDAETRLNPAASASYFGASGGPGGDSGSQSVPPATQSPFQSSTEQAAIDVTATPLSADELAEIAQLPLEDQQLAKQQVLCPVTMEPLGSMGIPLKVMIQGEPVMVCCQGCLQKAQDAPEATLQKVKQWRRANANAP